MKISGDRAAGAAAAADIPLVMAALPVLLLLAGVVGSLICAGSDFVASYSWILLLGASLAGIFLFFGREWLLHGRASLRGAFNNMLGGLKRSARQTLPALPILLLIGTVAATWMLSGVVPLMIHYGLMWINPTAFLVTACCVCAFISLLTGSSWTTIATIGVAFMGIGELLGYSAGWIAGAIISGAYFGDKVSPLSDTTVLASSSSGVDLFRHIRYMLITTIPSLLLALLVFLIAGCLTNTGVDAGHSEMLDALEATFNLNNWILLIPGITFTLILLRVNTLLTLLASTLLGLGGIFIFQPQMLQSLAAENGTMRAVWDILVAGTSPSTGLESLDSLVATGGITGMMPTVLLVVMAMLFGAVMFGSGYLKRITSAFTERIHNRVSAVGSTAASGLFLNCATADQYLSLIIGGSMFRNLYERLGLEGRLLSRTLEDSVSVTSVLIPWNSCGVTQSAVLGVATLTYLPFCVFNYLSPLMSLMIALTGFRIVQEERPQAAPVCDSVCDPA